MELSKYVACICEGSAEQAIMELLLDANKLIFVNVNEKVSHALMNF